MPITYSVHADGHFIHAHGQRPVTAAEWIDFEIAHAIDGRIKAPVSELFEIEANALEDINRDDVEEVMRRRGEIDRPPTRHRCAIALGSLDEHSWDLAKFYEGMAMLHSPEAVIVFANPDIARKWIGFSTVSGEE